MIQLSLHIGSSVLWLLEIHGSIFVCHRDGEGEATTFHVQSPVMWTVPVSEGSFYLKYRLGLVENCSLLQNFWFLLRLKRKT